MEIIQQIFEKNGCFKAGRLIRPEGIMVHSTGANNPNLRRYLPGDEIIGCNGNGNHWNTPGLNVCVHAFIGLDKCGSVRVYQTLPWCARGWHCAGSGNDTHISFEICEDGLDDAYYFYRVYAAAVELCVFLCREFSLAPDNVICHAEGFEQGIASNHADVRHWFSRFGETMDGFRAAVATKLLKTEVENVTEPSNWAKDACEWAAEKGYFLGDEDGEMGWHENITKEQLAVILKRVAGK